MDEEEAEELYKRELANHEDKIVKKVEKYLHSTGKILSQFHKYRNDLVKQKVEHCHHSSSSCYSHTDSQSSEESEELAVVDIFKHTQNIFHSLDTNNDFYKAAKSQQNLPTNINSQFYLFCKKENVLPFPLFKCI